MLLADDLRVENTAVGSQRVDGGIDAFFRDAPLQVDEGIQVLEGVGGRGVGRVVGGHVDGLHAR